MPPSVWDILERKLRLELGRPVDTDTGGFLKIETLKIQVAHCRERLEVTRLEGEIDKKGTDRDRLILSLFDRITFNLDGSHLSNLPLEEFQQFRSRVEALSNEEIAGEIRKQQEEVLLKIKGARLTEKPRAVFGDCIISSLMPSEHEVSEMVAAGRITKREAVELMEEALWRELTYNASEQVEQMVAAGRITKREVPRVMRQLTGRDRN